MKKCFNYFAITTCFVIGTSLAHANPDSSHENMRDQMFKVIDTNSDGTLTRDEFNTFTAKKFQQMDANGDGQLSSEEMSAANKKMMSGESNRLSDGDSSKARSKNDSASPKSETKATDGSNNSCCWTPDSSANRSGKKVGNAQNKKMDGDDKDD
ncbi:MAG: EF-hand domain-containing protein [Pseudomonadota bacterium]|nr:EF-hand domain-containing protein [Pseudomonadota bacterium]